MATAAGQIWTVAIERAMRRVDRFGPFGTDIQVGILEIGKT